MEIVLDSARSEQIEIDLHSYSNLTDYSTFSLKLTNQSRRLIDGMNTVIVEIRMYRDFTPLLLNTYLPTLTLTVINQLTNYFIGYELFEGISFDRYDVLILEKAIKMDFYDIIFLRI